MKIIVTGLNGTVAPAVARALCSRGHEVVAWDRSRVPIDDRAAIDAFLDRERPAYVFHVATGPAEWAEAVARACAGRGEHCLQSSGTRKTIGRACADRGIGLVFTSSVSVFSDQQTAPIRPDAVPDATDDYGRYKADCEARVRRDCPHAIIVRLGWQIGDAPGSNNMVDYPHRLAERSRSAGAEQQDEEARPTGQSGAARASGAAGGTVRIEVSRRWIPSCSFLDDTAATICDAFERLQPDTYHLEGNPGLSLYDIAVRLNRLHAWGWTIEPTDTPARNNLMADERLSVRPITARLGNGA